MKRSHRRAIAGLLCACGFVGCAQIPSRGLFIRRAATDESVTEEPAVPTDGIADSSARSSREHSADEPGRSERTLDKEIRQESRELSSSGRSPSLSGGLFGVSSGSSTAQNVEPVEAPSPKRRTMTKSPNTTSPATDKIPFASPANGPPRNVQDERNGVVSAEYQITPGQRSADIELAAAQSASASNPWDRFRGLTSDPNTQPESAELSEHSSQPTIQRVEDWPNSTSMPSNIAPSNVNTPPNGDLDRRLYDGQAKSPVPTWPQPASGNSTTGSSQETNGPSMPEPWPRSSSSLNVASSPNGAVDMAIHQEFSSRGASTDFAGANAAPPQHVQWVNADQPSSNSTPLGFNALSDPTSTAQIPATNGNPFNFGAAGVSTAIPAFASSPELDRLITQTTVEAAAITPGDNDVSRQLYLRKQVQLRLLQLIAGQTDRALQPVPGIESVDQEFWQLMVWGMANYFDTQGMPDASERAAQTISQLRAASARLQERAGLQLQNVAFCRKISGFGNYQRFSRDEFASGQPVLLYAEVDDFKSEPTPDGQFRTLMKSTLEIIEGGPNGRVVETLPLTPSEDRCRNQRRDYYHSYEFSIPQNCNPGPHTLRLKVEDQLGKKTAVTTLNFTVQ